MSKAYGVVSPKDLHGIRVAFIVIIFWIGIWNLVDMLIENISERYNVEKWKLYATLVLLALLFIILDPYTFENLI